VTLPEKIQQQHDQDTVTDDPVKGKMVLITFHVKFEHDIEHDNYTERSCFGNQPQQH
jgi:hypothetical protein